MPKKGDRARKLRSLSSGHGVRSPKAWFNRVKKDVSKQYPGFGQARKGQIIGGICARMSIANKKKIVRKYQK